MLLIPASGFVRRGDSPEALIVAEPRAWGEAQASVADNALVGYQCERVSRGMVHQHLDVDVPRFHPGFKIADRALAAWFWLRNHYAAVDGRGVVGKPQREGGGGAHAVPRGVQGVWQQGIKINVLTSYDALLYLVWQWQWLRSR